MKTKYVMMIADEKPPRPRLIRTGMRQYHFEYKNGFSMALIAESDVNYVTGLKVGCCGKKKYPFRLATPEEVALWERNHE